MAHIDVGSGISQGIQLGTAGFAVGGPIGGLIGGGIGLIKGLTGGRGRQRQERRLRSRNEKLLEMLQENFNRLKNQRAGDTASFQTGRAELGESINRQARADSGAAAARGLTGSSFEIGQAANRARALGVGTGRLLAGSEATLSADRRAALARLLQGTGQATQTDLHLLGAQDQRSAQQGAAVGSAFQAAGAAGLFGRTTNSPSPAQEPFLPFSPFGPQAQQRNTGPVGQTGGAFSPDQHKRPTAFSPF